MKLSISKDYFDNFHPPRLFLCQTDKAIINELKAYNISGTFKWNTYSELTFSIDRKYNDIITGETVVDPLFDMVEGLRIVYAEDVGYFQIQDPDTKYGDNDSKTVTCFSLEYATGQKYLDTFYINTGADESQEVTYWASLLGNDYWDQNSYYKLAGDAFNAYTRYYIKNYTDNTNYTYAEVAIANDTEFATYDKSTVAKTLYVKSYPNVQFYNPTVQQLSLLHLVFSHIPEWSIGSVDASLQKQERKFEVDRTAVYDFLMNDVCDAFDCVVEWDTKNNLVNFYEEADDGITDDNEVQSRFDTDVFISKDNLANELNISYSTDNIKTKLKVTGGDDMSIRDVNLGQNYIMNIDYYHTVGWMGESLYTKYSQYKTLIENTKPQYTTAMQQWVSAYNAWNDLENAVPATNDVLLVGDSFVKLYCKYVPADSSESSITTAANALKKWLGIYHVDDDTEATTIDNVLLTLKDASENSATLRVYYDTTNSVYKVRRTVINASTGVGAILNYTIQQWVEGTLTASFMNLDGYKIASIGTLGAYLCLTKDETVTANLQDYGIKMLEEKQQTYTLIFQTQTEGMLSNEKYQCVASDTVPTGEIPDGTRWLDTDSSPVKLYLRNSSSTSGEYSGWDEYDITLDRANYEDYARYIENYNKLQAVQTVLVAKQVQANLYLDGIQIEGIYITSTVQMETNLRNAVTQYFGVTPTNWVYNSTTQSATFTISSAAYAVYLVDAAPYIAYQVSQGYALNTMNYLKSATEMSTYFTSDELTKLSAFIREDEYSNSDIALTGYESEEERISLCNELVEAAEKELKALCQPSLEFNMTMANIFTLPEFEPLLSQFQLGNIIRVGLPNNMVKRARLLECSINFNDLSDFSCTFGNLITTKSEIDIHAELLSQAINAGKSVASSANTWKKGAQTANSLSQSIQNGLEDATLNIGKENGQSIEIGQYGIWGRKLDPTTNQYSDEQFRIMNNKIMFSDDGFKTSKSIFGKYTINNEEKWGLMADNVSGGLIEGSSILGGSLKIGDYNNANGTYFEVDENGNVTIKKNGQVAYADASVVAQIESSGKYRVELSYSGSTVINTTNQSCIITAAVYQWDTDITSILPVGTTFNWKRSSNGGDTEWNNSHIITKTSNNSSTVNQITITHADINNSAQFACEVQFDDTNL